jgi:hypothetical protein
MLRIYFLRQCFNLSEPDMEKAFYESFVRRQFRGLNLGRASAPDGTAICRFRQLLERHELGGEILDQVKRRLDRKGSRSLPHCPTSKRGLFTGQLWIRLVFWSLHLSRIDDRSGARSMKLGVCGVSVDTQFR